MQRTLILIAALLFAGACKERRAGEAGRTEEGKPMQGLVTVRGEVEDVNLDEREITIVPREGGNALTLKLSDTGAGIDNLEGILKEGADVRASYDPNTMVARRIELVAEPGVGEQQEKMEEQQEQHEAPQGQ